MITMKKNEKSFKNKEESNNKNEDHEEKAIRMNVCDNDDE